MTIIEQTK